MPADNAFSDEPGFLRDRHVTIVYPDGHRRSAEDVLQLYPFVRAELENTLRWPIGFRPTVVLVGESAEFRQMTGRAEVVALAVPRRDLILIDLSALSSHPFNLETSLQHELCHLSLHSRIPEGSLPRWLDEGIAQWASGGLSEIRLPRKRSFLDQALLSKRTIPLEALSEGFEKEGRTLLLAYEQSRSVVRFLIDRFGVDTLLSILKSLSEGTSFEQALWEHCSLTTASLEQAWLEDLEGKFAWSAVLIEHLYQILFFFAGAVLMVGFVRHLKKKRAAMRALDDPDEGGG